MKPSRWSGLPKRIFTAVLLASFSMVAIWSGLFFFVLEIVFGATAGVAEYFDMVERKGLRPARRMGTAAVVGWLLLSCYLSEASMNAGAVIGFLLMLMIMPLRSRVRSSALLDVGATWLGVGYVGWLFGYLIRVREVPGLVPFHGMMLSKGALLITFLVLICTVTDTAAYFVGRTLGRNLLCPAVSPGKTIEGSLGGLLAAMWLSRAFAVVLGASPAAGLLFGAVVSTAGQLGDLWESALKRDAGVKDSGDLIGGHGGVLDRFDSLAFAAPVFYVLGQALHLFGGVL